VAGRELLLRRATYARLGRAAGPHPPWEDLLILTTCNRIEIYAVARLRRETFRIIFEALDLPEDSPAVYVLEGTEAVAHLLRVASGLDSLAQGEEQIAAQVRQAPGARPASWRKADTLASLFSHAVHVATRLRRLAGVERNPASASHAAIRFVESAVPIPHPAVVLLGTGKMARIAAEALRGRASLTVVSRSARKARDIGMALGGTGVGLASLERHLIEADVVLAATATQKPLLTVRLLRRIVRRRAGRPLWLIDLGFPRNIAEGARSLPGVVLVDIDGLAPWGARPLPPTVQARVEARIREEAERIVGDLRPEDAADVAEFRKAAEALRRREVEEALSRLPRLTEEERAIVDKLASRLVNRFLHGPTESLRALPDETRSQILARFLAGLQPRGGDPA